MKRYVQFVIAAGLVLVSASHGYAVGVDPCPVKRSSAGPLTTLWAELDKATKYRCLELSGGRCERATHSTTIANYQKPIIGTETPREVFERLAGPAGFGKFATSPDAQVACEAKIGIQETLNELMTGQTVLGNDLLLKGLRTRFPGNGDPADPDQLTLLKAGARELADGINSAVDELRLRPAQFRTRGAVNVNFPFWVENLPRSDQNNGDQVESEIYRFTDLVRLNGLASNSVGKRVFFFENETAEGKAEAAALLKESAQATYLNTAVLAALQSTRDFNINKGPELKKQIVDAQRVYEDIQSGFNPLNLLGDFVPHQPFENLMVVFDSLTNDAINKEATASQLGRSYDESQTALANELQAQQQGNVNQISALTGIPLDQILQDFDLLSEKDRKALVDSARTSADSCIVGVAGACVGEIGLRAQAVRGAGLQTEVALAGVGSLKDQIRNEEQRAGRVATVTRRNGVQAAATAVAEAVANSFQTENGASSFGPFTAVKFNPLAEVLGGIRQAQQLIRMEQELEIADINSESTVANLLAQQASRALDVESAGALLEARKAELAEAFADLERAIRNALSSRSNLTSAYFSNPAYRLQLDLARENADASFEAAMVQGYYATKALEYEWSERLANPVERIDGLLPEPIGDAAAFDGITAAESVFGSRSAGSPQAPSPGF